MSNYNKMGRTWSKWGGWWYARSKWRGYVRSKWGGGYVRSKWGGGVHVVSGGIRT